ncbi:MAG: M12 family metallo-peptidase [Bdellovibrionota bacterium]
MSVYFTGCASESGSGSGTGGVNAAGARRELPSAEDVANGSDLLTIAVRYLSFRDSSGTAVASESKVRNMIDNDVAAVWRQCGISFKLERYEAVDASYANARYSPANYSELNQMRINTQSENDLVIIGTGTWNRAGDLGNSGSNCYSSFPGDRAEGIVCEKKSAGSSLIMAHEVGHWLNLRHTNSPTTDAVNDTTSRNVAYNLMDHIVRPSNDELTKGQCVRARTAIGEWRRRAVL